MKPHQIASLPRTTALLACIAALVLALAASSARASSGSPQVTERDDGLTGVPQVVDPPSDRIASASAATSPSGTTSSDDGDSNAPLIVGISVLTVALLGSGMYVVRRHRRLAPGH